jgi:AAT family amino acid transporter
MPEYTTKRAFKSSLGNGFAALLICIALSMILWPIWSLIAKAIFTPLAQTGLTAAGAVPAAQLIGAMVEGSFFWMVINPWIWQTLIMSNYGKTRFTEKQPWAGLWYTLGGWFFGIVGFVVLIGFIGLWWKPFSLGLMFMPKTAADVALAYEGWEAANFFALAVIVAQIPFASLLQRWPFAGTSKQPTEGLGTLAFSTLVTYVFWIALIVPSFLHLSAGEHVVTSQPYGSWPQFVAFCQAFVIFSIMPAEGAENYPMKLFAKKQPYMAIIGFVIALAAGFLIPPAIKSIVGPMNLVPGTPVYVVVASLELSVIVFMLAWHHLFEDYPNATVVKNTAWRVLSRVAIWLVGGTIYGVVWLKTFKSLPIGGNSLGMGFPTMGILAGQFALLMAILLFNSFFDKWPLIRKQIAPPKK